MIILNFKQYNESYLHYIEAPAIKGVNKNKILNLVKDDNTKYLFFKDVNDDDVKFLNKYLKDNKYNMIECYHGTSSKLNIMNDGLKKTSIKTKKSYQSETGYVYVSIFEDMAKTFGKMAYPSDDITVYKLNIPIYFLKPDKDQLRNKRLYSNVDVNETLGDSALYGYGFRIKGDIPPYMITKL